MRRYKTRRKLHNEHILSVPWRYLSRENVPYGLPFSNGFGIRLNGSGYPFKKNCHPFERLGLSVWKKLSSVRTAWDIRLKKVLSVRTARAIRSKNWEFVNVRATEAICSKIILAEFPSGEGKRRKKFAERHVAWLAEWHYYAECNICRLAQRNKLNRKPTRFSVAPFFGRRGFFVTNFEGATSLPVRLLLLAQTNKAKRHVGVHDDYEGNQSRKWLLGKGRLGSHKWNKQISLVNTCRRTASQIWQFFYLGVHNLYFTKLKSRVTHRNARGKRSNARWTWSRIYLISEYYVTITQPTVSKMRKTSHAVSNTVPAPVTRTLKGNHPRRPRGG